MRWMVVVCVAVIGLGCSRAHQELVEITPENARVEALELTEPSGAVPVEELAAPALIEERPAAPAVAELTPAPQEDVEDYVKAAQRMLSAGDFATASLLLQDAFTLDPNARSLRSLQAKLEKAQRQAEEKAHRELISLYEREGLEILKQGDEDRALTYFHAAQALDPTNRKIFKRIQQANVTWHKRRAQQREVEFELGKTIENGVAVLGASGTSAGASQLAAQTSLSTEASTLLAQPPAPEPVPPAPETVTTKAAAAAPEAPVEFGGGVGGYTIRPGDVLQITVYEEPDLTTKARVSSEGEIVVPLLGRVSVAGATVTRVQEHLTRLLGEDYLVNPQVQVFIETYQPRNVFVTGAVNKPGAYPIPTERPTTVMEAVAIAGGFSEDAAANKTRIIRTEQGVKQTIEVNADEIIKRGDKTKDVIVYANDIIFVPESFF